MRSSTSSVRAIAVILLSGAVLALTGCDSAGSNQEQTPQGENQPPTAEASVSSSTVDVGKEVTLDGSGSSDPDGDDLTYNWSLNAPSGSNASLSDPNAVEPTFTADVTGDYEATLEVSDGTASDTDQAMTTAESATTEISSNITSDRTLSADTTYVVTTNVIVQNSSTLTIEPGTEIQFEDDEALRIRDESALVADGTSSEPITMIATEGNEQSGWWRGVGIYTSSTNNILNHVEIRHAGGSKLNGISEVTSVGIEAGAALTLTNSTIANGDGYGLYLDAEDSSLDSFTDNSFSGHANAPIYIPFTNIGKIDSGTSFADGSTVRVRTARLTSDATITALSGDTPYRLTGKPKVDGGVVTVEPGVDMVFESEAAFRVESGSEFAAEGTADNPITMTATDGDEQPGWWAGVAIYSSNANNILDHVEIRHAAGAKLSGISEITSVGIEAGAATSITNATIADGDGYGLYLDAEDSSLDSFADNSFSGHANAPIYIPFTNIGKIDSGTSFADGSTVRVRTARLTSDATITALSGDTPYRLTGKPKVDGGVVTVEPGVDMVFESEAAFRVESGSEFAAEGTADNPITMTATDGNEQPGWWAGVAIYSSNTNNTLDHVEIRHAAGAKLSGISELTNVGIEAGAALTLTNSTITDSDNHGVFCDASDSSLSASGNSYSNNAGQNVADCQ